MSFRGSAAPTRRGFVQSWLGLLFPAPYETYCGVRFRVVRRGRGPRRYLFIHGDEFTAYEVVQAHMANHAGTAWLVTGRERNVTITGVKIDPNRMWSRAGAEASLRLQNPGISNDKVAAALAFLSRDRETLIRKLTPGPGSRLVAVHNNREYSVQDEVAASDKVSIKQPDMSRYFFLCTDPKDFEILRSSPYNVVLQTKADPDDGSMSRLAARRGFRYINLECAINDAAGQKERLEWLDRHVG